VKTRCEIEDRASKIPKDDIEQVDAGDSEGYRVRSQTNGEVWYSVDVDAYTCGCLGYPLIKFCKHLCAVQLHFPCKVTPRPFPQTSSSELSISCVPATRGSTPSVDDPIPDANTAALIAHKLSILLRMHASSPWPDGFIHALQHLEPALDLAISEIPTLPKANKLPPYQNSWTETAAVMGAKRKIKRKVHEDPYSGGQQSGKKAKADARTSHTKRYAIHFCLCRGLEAFLHH
jgi:hypothetical protein